MGSIWEKIVVSAIIFNCFNFVCQWLFIGYYISEFYKENSYKASWLLVHVVMTNVLQFSVYCLLS